MEEPDTIQVWVTSVIYRGGPVARGRGETDEGDLIDFAVEPRALWAVSEAIDAGHGPVLLAVPTWWNPSRRPPRTTTPAA